VLVTGCNNDDDNNADKLTTQEFMMRAANSDMFEIQTGHKATLNGNLPAVKAFGQHLVHDHTQTSMQLKALATQKNITLPDSITEDKRVIRNRLASETGKTFDQDFANVQIMAHDEAITLYTRASTEVTDPEVRTFAAQGLPLLKQHRQEAQQLKTLADAQ
jgi:putative membrane protein